MAVRQMAEGMYGAVLCVVLRSEAAARALPHELRLFHGVSVPSAGKRDLFPCLA